MRMRAIAGLILLPAAIAQAATFQQKGVNFTAEGRGGYGGERAIETLRDLPKYGVNSIALVPYGMTRRGGSTIRFGGMERDDDIVRIAQERTTSA